MFIKGVSFGFLAKNGYYSSDVGQKEIDRICDTGVNWVALVATVMQDQYSSTRMYSDFEYTPSDCELVDTINRFHENDVKVMLKPMIECHDSVWRGKISFPKDNQQIQGIVTDYWGEWFKNYTNCMKYYARIAKDSEVEMLCLGCEMHGTEPMEEYWPQLIEQVRECYAGLLTYNASGFSPDDSFLRKWYSQLDLLGISFYNGSPRDNPSADEIAYDLKPTVGEMDSCIKKMNIPIFFAECGARSIVDGVKSPSNYRNSGEYDGDIQARYLEAVIKAFSDCDWWKGLLWWKWDEQQNRPHYSQPTGDTGFTIRNKPAAEIMRNWCTL
jgi:hypothetical protein